MSLFQMGVFGMEKYRYKNVEPVCIHNFTWQAVEPQAEFSNLVGVDCHVCTLAHCGSSDGATDPPLRFASPSDRRIAISTGEGRRACARV